MDIFAIAFGLGGTPSAEALPAVSVGFEDVLDGVPIPDQSLHGPPGPEPPPDLIPAVEEVEVSEPNARPQKLDFRPLPTEEFEIKLPAPFWSMPLDVEAANRSIEAPSFLVDASMVWLAGQFKPGFFTEPQIGNLPPSATTGAQPIADSSPVGPTSSLSESRQHRFELAADRAVAPNDSTAEPMPGVTEFKHLSAPSIELGEVIAELDVVSIQRLRSIGNLEPTLDVRQDLIPTEATTPRHEPQMNRTPLTGEFRELTNLNEEVAIAAHSAKTKESFAPHQESALEPDGLIAETTTALLPAKETKLEGGTRPSQYVKSVETGSSPSSPVVVDPETLLIPSKKTLLDKGVLDVANAPLVGTAIVTVGSTEDPAVDRSKPIAEPEIDLIVKQVADRMHMLAAARPRQGVAIHLNPEEFGSITLVVKSIGRMIETQITASDVRVSEALDQNQGRLAEAMDSRGYQLQSVSVHMPSNGSTLGEAPRQNSSQQGQPQQNQHGQSQGHRGQPERHFNQPKSNIRAWVRRGESVDFAI